MFYEIEIFRNGYTFAPGPEIFFLSKWNKTYKLYTYFFLLKSKEHNILIDTGCGDLKKINQMLYKEFEGKISFEIPEHETTKSILKRRNINPSSIDFVFISHFHHDHISNIDLFPNAKFVFSKIGLVEYIKKNRTYYYDDILFPIKSIQYLLSLSPERIISIEDELEVLPGITAFWVGGHTPCCIAIEVASKKGNVVFTSDVAFFIDNIKKNHPIGLFYNLWEVFEAYKKINKRADIIITSHDPNILDKYFKDGII